MKDSFSWRQRFSTPVFALILNTVSWTTFIEESFTASKVYNEQIAKGLLDNAYYPFGRHEYQIPQTELREKAICKEQLQKLHEYQPEQLSWEDKGKDLCFFFYLCNGMNVKDMCRLRYSTFKADHFTYTRAKTEGRNKHKKEIVVILNDAIKTIIEK